MMGAKCVWASLMGLALSTAGMAQETKQKTVDSLSLQDSVSVKVLKADNIPVKAGERINFTVTLDKAPNFKGGIHYTISTPSGGLSMNTGFDIFPGQRTYQFSYDVPAGAPGGIWTLKIDSIGDGLRFYPFDGPTQTFQVIANPHLVFPTSATIVVNPSQQQLLRRAAVRLEGRIQDLKSLITSYQAANQQKQIPYVLRANIIDSVKALEETQHEFTKLANEQNQSDRATVFFGDLRLNYNDLLNALDVTSGSLLTPNELVQAAYSGAQRKEYPILAQAALRPFELNELAYTVVADSGLLVFDLTVSSNPSGATISYFRRGDAPQTFASPTTAVIPALTFAIWYVKLEKQGYKTETREHDPFHSSNHVVDVELRR